ncbi:MAG: hypothetical protein HY557_03475 [Euryarchaeota archaeon]|nr:hypothetical protein [Euryarchaeota archaeon]
MDSAGQARPEQVSRKKTTSGQLLTFFIVVPLIVTVAVIAAGLGTRQDGQPAVDLERVLKSRGTMLEFTILLIGALSFISGYAVRDILGRRAQRFRQVGTSVGDGAMSGVGEHES